MEVIIVAAYAASDLLTRDVDQLLSPVITVPVSVNEQVCKRLAHS
jgi:hypothetical protein